MQSNTPGLRRCAGRRSSERSSGSPAVKTQTHIKQITTKQLRLAPTCDKHAISVRHAIFVRQAYDKSSYDNHVTLVQHTAAMRHSYNIRQPSDTHTTYDKHATLK